MENCCEDKVKYKKTPRTKEDVSKLKNRLSRIQGQIEGVKKMLDEGRYCGDVLIQTSAIKKAVEAVSYEILKEHLLTCVAEEIKNDNLAIINETIDVIKKI